MAVLSVALLASSCGGTDELDTEDVAFQLQETLSESLGQNITVECPEDVSLEEGREFTCDASGSEGDFGIVVTQTDDEGSVTAKRASLDIPAVEEQIAESLEQLGGIDIAVDCPDDVEVGEGLKFTCNATSERGKLDFVVEQTDDFGTITFRPRPATD